MVTLPHAKKIITRALRQAESEALDDGIDVTSDKFKEVMAKIKDRLLEEMGISQDDYSQYNESLKDIGRSKAQKKKEEIIEELSDLRGKLIFRFPNWEEIDGKPHIPTDEEIIDIAHEIAHQYIKPPQVINKIIKEKVIEKPITIIEKQEYDDSHLQKRLNELDDQLAEVEHAKSVDVYQLKEDMRKEFGEMFEHNIDILGMPNFRKLAMGLQDQIDNIGTSGVSSNVQSVSLNSQLDGIETIFIIPAYSRILTINYSSFPFILDPDSDYTEINNTTIQINNFVPQLGQTLIVTYVAQ